GPYLPLRYFEAGDTARSQMRPHIVGHHAEVLRDKNRRQRGSLNDADDVVAQRAVGDTILQRGVVARSEAGQSSVRSRGRLLVEERQEFGIAVRSPREGIQPVEPQYVIDSKAVE